MTSTNILSVWDMTRVWYEASRALSITVLDMGRGVNLPPHWTELDHMQDYSELMSATTFVLEDPDVGPEELQQYIASQMPGWSYGPVMDPDRKKSPWAVPFSELPEGEQLRLILIISIIRTLVEAS